LAMRVSSPMDISFSTAILNAFSSLSVSISFSL